MLTWILASFVLAVRLVQPAPETSFINSVHGSRILSDRFPEGNDPGPQFRGEAADEESEEEGLDWHESAHFAPGQRVGSSWRFLFLGTDFAAHPCTTNDRCR